MQPLRLMQGGAAPRERMSEEERWERISELFADAREGRLPRTRDLKDWEPQILNELHLQWIMMRAQGMMQKDIARVAGYTDSRVSIVLNSPDATYLLDKLHGLMGVETVSIENRLQLLNDKAIEAIEDAFDSEGVKPIERAKLGFALLERNGHGAKKEVEVKHSHSFAPTPAAASILAAALRESRQIEDVEYVEVPLGPGFQPSIALGEGGPSGSSSFGVPPIEVGAQDSEGDA